MTIHAPVPIGSPSFEEDAKKPVATPMTHGVFPVPRAGGAQDLEKGTAVDCAHACLPGQAFSQLPLQAGDLRSAGEYPV
jgi:hypothetical protein